MHVQKISLLVAFAFMMFGCGTKKKTEDGTSGNAKLSLSRSTSLNLDSATTYTPSKFSVKFLSAYIVSDVDESSNNVGIGNYIWTNPDCVLSDSTTEIESKSYTYKTLDSSCRDDKVSTFLELARDSSEVNADLNSQNLPVLPGTYNYVRLEICVGSATTDTIKFQADGMSDVLGVKNGTCGVTSAKAATPITIAEGESVAISLAYDLTGIVYDYGSGMTKSDNCYFSDDSTVRRCVNFPSLTLSASKQ